MKFGRKIQSERIMNKAFENIIKYKGYNGTVQYSVEDDCLWGRLIGITDIISYEGQSIEEIKKDFEETVEWYLNDCAERGKKPETIRDGNGND